jgi:uncharacterized membrane protein YkvA (DUF1232 family)
MSAIYSRAASPHAAPPSPEDRGPEAPAGLGRVGPRKRRGITLIPFVGDLVAMTRLIRDRGAPVWAKLLVAVAILYVVLPFDAVTDLVPVIGWLDDIGLVVVLRLLLYRQIEPYRYPLGRPPKAPELAPKAASSE